ncbi:hypothetical protein KIH78_10500, partial [Bifidobacterium sp. 79T10]|nr:hypothetical protein [Bifidobacterium saguinibicoloris]
RTTYTQTPTNATPPHHNTPQTPETQQTLGVSKTPKTRQQTHPPHNKTTEEKTQSTHTRRVARYRSPRNSNLATLASGHSDGLTHKAADTDTGIVNFR